MIQHVAAEVVGVDREAEAEEVDVEGDAEEASKLDQRYRGRCTIVRKGAHGFHGDFCPNSANGRRTCQLSLGLHGTSHHCGRVSSTSFGHWRLARRVDG